MYQALGDKLGIAISIERLGSVRRSQGELGEARSLYEKSLAIHQELGSRSGIAFSLVGLGEVILEQGDVEAAGSLFQRSLAIVWELEAGRARPEPRPHAALARRTGLSRRAERAFDGLRQRHLLPLGPGRLISRLAQFRF